MATPLYQQTRDEIARRIRTGVYKRGENLPSQEQLANEFGVSLITIRRAINELELDGLVDRRHGIGNQVRNATRPLVISISSFNADVKAGRIRIVRTLLQYDTVPASEEVARKLHVQTGSQMRHFSRLDAEGGMPFSVDDVYVPAVLAAEITSEMAGSPLFLQLWQAASRMVVERSECEFEIAIPTQADLQQLQMCADIPLLVTREVMLDASGTPLMLFVSRNRGDRCRISATVVHVPMALD